MGACKRGRPPPGQSLLRAASAWGASPVRVRVQVRAGQGRAGPRRLPQAGPPVNIGRCPDRGQLLGPVSPAAAALPLPFGFFFLFTEF